MIHDTSGTVEGEVEALPQLGDTSRLSIVCVLATEAMFGSELGTLPQSADVVCIDLDDRLVALDEIARWVSEITRAHKQALVIGSPSSLSRLGSSWDGNATLVEKVDSLSGLSGVELVDAIGVSLNEIFAPFERTELGFRARSETGVIDEAEIHEDFDREIDEEFTSPLLSARQRVELLAAVNAPDDQSEDDEEDDEQLEGVKSIFASSGVHRSAATHADSVQHDQQLPLAEAQEAVATYVAG